MGDYLPILIAFLIILLLPLIIIGFVASFYEYHFQDHKKKYYIGAVVFELSVVLILFGAGAVL
mgnify:CR=1 FL=1